MLKIHVSRKMWSDKQGSNEAGAELDIPLPDDASGDQIEFASSTYYALLTQIVDKQIAAMTGERHAPEPRQPDRESRPPHQERRDDRESGYSRNGNGGGSRLPRTGKALFAYLCKLRDSDMHYTKIIDEVNAWGERNQLPRRMTEWNEREVGDCVNHFEFQEIR